VIELTRPFPLIFLLNSFLTITLIFNQNDSPKESTQNSISAPNPIEIATWVCFLLQLVLLLLKTKLTDFYF
jgi:uncharacterized protein with PQ loop repeat